MKVQGLNPPAHLLTQTLLLFILGQHWVLNNDAEGLSKADLTKRPYVTSFGGRAVAKNISHNLETPPGSHNIVDASPYWGWLINCLFCLYFIFVAVSRCPRGRTGLWTARLGGVIGRELEIVFLSVVLALVFIDFVLKPNFPRDGQTHCCHCC